MRIYALAALKGGVGKTTAVVNLAALAARSGARTLVWDLDPQGGATFSLGVDPAPGDAVVWATGERPPMQPVSVDLGSGLRVDVLPADLTLRHLDVELASHNRPRRRFSAVVRLVVQGYDVVFLDCPAGMGLAVEAALRAADVIVVPVPPGPLSTRAYDVFASAINAEKRLRRRRLVGFASMVDRRKLTHRAFELELPKRLGAVPVASVPLLAEIERGPASGRPVVVTNPTGPAARAYEALWAQLAVD